jgi:hypothetical protein
LAGLLWIRQHRNKWKAVDPEYWRDPWRNRSKAERQQYQREYMRQYRRGFRRRATRAHTCKHCLKRAAQTTLSAFLLILLLGVGCGRSQPPQRLPLIPEHRRILSVLGWLEFVEANVDLLRYYDWPGFASNQGPATGLANYSAGKRTADIATRDRSDRDVVATIVHEAAHLAGINSHGEMFDENYADSIEKRFLSTYDNSQATHATEKVVDQTDPIGEFVIRVQVMSVNCSAQERKQHEGRK